jgi:hypothetical protein
LAGEGSGFSKRVQKRVVSPDGDTTASYSRPYTEHSLTIFLIATGLGWVILFSRVDPESKWGTVVSNIVSEWSQQIGLVVLTKGTD